MSDTHAHLDACDVPLSELLERARSVGVTRVVHGFRYDTAADVARAAELLAGPVRDALA